MKFITNFRHHQEKPNKKCVAAPTLSGLSFYLPGLCKHKEACSSDGAPMRHIQPGWSVYQLKLGMGFFNNIQ